MNTVDLSIIVGEKGWGRPSTQRIYVCARVRCEQKSETLLSM